MSQIHQISANQVVSLLNRQAGIQVLTELIKIDPMELSRVGRIDYLSALEKQTAWLQALMQRAIIAVAGEEPSVSDSMWAGVDDYEREDVATALRLSGGTAQLRIDVARTLTNHLPMACSALATGEISAAHANIIARELAPLIDRGVNAQVLSEIETKAISHSEFHTPAQVAHKVRTMVAKSAPEKFEEIAESSRSCRRVNLYPEADGMATLVALLPITDAQTIILAVDKLARATKEGNDVDEKISIDAYRADALTLLATNYLAASENEILNHRRPVTLNLTLDLATVLGLANNPGELAGFGPIPASIARELAMDAKWRRFITEPVSGVLLDYGRESYEPPQALVDFLLARDRTCRFPGCRQPARTADIDHAQPWDEGGETSIENLGLLCRRHHRLKTHGNWKLDSYPDGSCEWTSPVGKKYQVPARPIGEAV